MSGLVSGIPRGGHGGHPRRALNLLDSALETASDAPASMQSWLLARRAEEHAMAGGSIAAHRDLEAASRTLASALPDTPFFHHLGDAWLAGYRGNCARLLGETKEAIKVLELSAAECSDGRPSDRSGMLADLAAAYALDGDHATAAETLAASLGLARQSGALIAEGRVRGVRRRYLVGSDTVAIRQLDELLIAP